MLAGSLNHIEILERFEEDAEEHLDALRCLGGEYVNILVHALRVSQGTTDEEPYGKGHQEHLYNKWRHCEKQHCA